MKYTDSMFTNEKPSINQEDKSKLKSEKVKPGEWVKNAEKIWKWLEKKSVQAKKELSKIWQKLSLLQAKAVKEKEQNNAKEQIDSELGGFNMWAGWNTKNPQDKIENFVENSDKKSLEKTENEYREILGKTFHTEMDELKNEAEEAKEAKMCEYLETYINKLKVEPEKISAEDLKNIKATLPDAYEAAFLNPEMKVGAQFQKVREVVLQKAKDMTKKDDYKTSEEYEDALRKNMLEIAGVHVEQEKFPNSDEYKTKEEYDGAVKSYQKEIQDRYGESSPEYFSAQSNWSNSYTPMTPSENFNAWWSQGGEILWKGENFKEWMEKSWPPEWKQIAKEFLEKMWSNEVDTNTPVLLANSWTNRAIFMHQGKWQEFPVIFWSGWFWDGKWQTPIKRIAKFHSVKMASSPQWDASVTGSRTVKWASLLSELWSSQGGKWWHGVDANRLNGGHTLGCVWLDPVLAMQFGQAIQKSGNRGYWYVS